MATTRDKNRYHWGGAKPGEGRAINPRKMLSMDPDVQGLLLQIATLSGRSQSAVVADLIRDTAQLMGLRVEDNDERFKL